MKPSEELMLLLELNNFDITRFKLKKHLEYEENRNIDLFIHQTYADLVISHYQFDESLDIRHRNPLTFNHTWDKGINSLSQFYVNHQDVNKEVTLGDFLLQESINEIRKENVLNDILYAWIDEHKTSSSVKLENYRELLILLPKKDKSYKKPSNIKFFVAILLSLLPIFLYAKPSLLQPSSISFVSNYIQDWNNLLSDFLWYYFIGIGSIILLLLYAVLNKVYAGTTNNVKDITKRKAVRIYSKWEKGNDKV